MEKDNEVVYDPPPDAFYRSGAQSWVLEALKMRAERLSAIQQGERDGKDGGRND